MYLKGQALLFSSESIIIRSTDRFGTRLVILYISYKWTDSMMNRHFASIYISQY